MIKIIKSTFFCHVEFIILTIRGIFIVYPLMQFAEECINKKELQKPKIKNENPTIQDNKEYHSKIVKRNKRIYTVWVKNKDKVNAFARISFIESEKTKIKKKDIILKYNLQIVEADTKEPEQPVQSKVLFNFLTT
jgi:lipopolysaccharide export LptBFGC system permease protein LptF